MSIFPSAMASRKQCSGRWASGTLSVKFSASHGQGSTGQHGAGRIAVTAEDPVASWTSDLKASSASVLALRRSGGLRAIGAICYVPLGLRLLLLSIS